VKAKDLAPPSASCGMSSVAPWLRGGLRVAVQAKRYGTGCRVRRRCPRGLSTAVPGWLADVSRSFHLLEFNGCRAPAGHGSRRTIRPSTELDRAWKRHRPYSTLQLFTNSGPSQWRRFWGRATESLKVLATDMTQRRYVTSRGACSLRCAESPQAPVVRGRQMGTCPGCGWRAGAFWEPQLRTGPTARVAPSIGRVLPRTGRPILCGQSWSKAPCDTATALASSRAW